MCDGKWDRHVPDRILERIKRFPVLFDRGGQCAPENAVLGLTSATSSVNTYELAPPSARLRVLGAPELLPFFHLSCSVRTVEVRLRRISGLSNSHRSDELWQLPRAFRDSDAGGWDEVFTASRR
jgi:hypothetical protein